LRALEAVLARDSIRLVAAIKGLHDLFLEGKQEASEQRGALEARVRRRLVKELLWPTIVRIDYEELLAAEEDDSSHE